MSAAIRDTAILFRRRLLHLAAYPSMTLMLIGMPLTFMLLFVYVFGGTMGAGIAGTHLSGATSRSQYLTYIFPAIIVDTSATGLGSSFATMDSLLGNVGNGGALYRPLSSSEYMTSLYYGQISNTVLNSANTLQGSFAQNSLTLNSGSSVTINPMPGGWHTLH